MQEAVKEKILKLLNNGIIYSISDNQWVSYVHEVSKKAGFTVVENEQKELVQTRLPTKVRVCIDYRKLNAATRYPSSTKCLNDWLDMSTIAS